MAIALLVPKVGWAACPTGQFEWNYWYGGTSHVMCGYTTVNADVDPVTQQPIPWIVDKAIQVYISGSGTWTYETTGGIKTPWYYAEDNGYLNGIPNGFTTTAYVKPIDSDTNFYTTLADTKPWIATKTIPTYVTGQRLGTTYKNYPGMNDSPVIAPTYDINGVSEFTYETDSTLPTADTPWSDFQMDLQNQYNNLGYDIAKESGCWKSDSDWITIPGKPDEAAYKVKGTGWWKDTTIPTDAMKSVEDYCYIDPQYPTGKSKLREYYCEVKEDSCVINDKCIGKEGCYPKKFCTAYMIDTPVTCKAGTMCQSGVCVPSPGEWDGCFSGQAPFLDTNSNGIPDSCFCPEGMYPKDTNADGNSDACGYRPEMCSLGTKSTKDVVMKAKGEENGGWTLHDFCTSPFKLESIVCGLDGIKSTSQKPCKAGQICVKGNCFDTDSDLCDNADTNLDPYADKGWVTINNSQVVTDKCGASASEVLKVYCTSPTDSKIDFVPKTCKAGDVCDTILAKCMPKDKSTAPASDPPVNNTGDSPTTPVQPYDDGSKDIPPAPKGCTLTTQKMCAEPTDSTHPTDPITGLKLYGDPYIPGKTQPSVTATYTGDNCPANISSPGKTIHDTCIWEELTLYPKLIQFGCEGNTVYTSTSTCNWTKGESCRWVKTLLEQAEFILNPDKFGFCVKNLPKAQVQLSGNKMTGTDAFGREVDHEFECAPAQGKSAIKKWKVVDSPEGALAYIESCPLQHFCKDGACLPEPCFQKNASDNNPCTQDYCDVKTGDIYNITIDSIDDNDPCTEDKCANDGGIAKITHTPITATLQCFCGANPTDSKCQNPSTPGGGSTPPTPGGSTPPKPIGGFDCNDPANFNDPQCKESLEYCIDDDIQNDKFTKGTAVLYPGTSFEKMASDTCAEYDLTTLQFTAVLQVACGPNKTFYYQKSACPLTGKGCSNGTCQP